MTATAAELMSASTPVAYAPFCRSTEAWKTKVTRIAISVKTITSGRIARAHAGAMP